MDTESHDTRQRQEPRENHDLVIDATAGERDPFAAHEAVEMDAQQDKRGQRFEEVLCEAIAEMIAKGMTV